MSLDLIFAMMGGQQVEAAVLAAPFGEQPIAGCASGLLYSTYRLVSRPGQDVVADRPRREPAMHSTDLSATFQPQAVIHCDRADAPAAHRRLADPLMGQKRGDKMRV